MEMTDLLQLMRSKVGDAPRFKPYDEHNDHQFQIDDWKAWSARALFADALEQHIKHLANPPEGKRHVALRPDRDYARGPG